MNRNHQRLNTTPAKEIDLIDYLSSLDYQPAKNRTADCWLLSPLRQERTPSFKVNRKLNCWYDHGLCKGGNLIDFGIQYHNCTVSELLHNIGNESSFHQPVVQQEEAARTQESEHRISVLGDAKLHSFALLPYQEKQQIPLPLAEEYCREIRFEIGHRTFYGFGFKNDSGGYEIWNPYMKLSSGPKDVTTVEKGSKEIAVFEGSMDFLSFKAIHQWQQEKAVEFVVLNSAALFEKTKLFMEQQVPIKLYLDRDATRQNCSRNALASSAKYKDESGRIRDTKTSTNG